MNIIGVGIDIAEIARYDSDDLAERVLSDEEMREYLRCADRPQFLSSRFAVKESYIKASQDKTIDFRRLEVRKDQDGKPELYLDKRRIPAFVSISHDRYAIAIVILYQD